MLYLRVPIYIFRIYWHLALLIYYWFSLKLVVFHLIYVKRHSADVLQHRCDVRSSSVRFHRPHFWHAAARPQRFSICAAAAIHPVWFIRDTLIRDSYKGYGAFFGPFSTVFLMDSYSADFTLSLIDHIGCIRRFLLPSFL